MGRLFKVLVRLLLTIVLIVVVTLAAFRGWAMLRETDDPQQLRDGAGRLAGVGGLDLRYAEWGPGDGAPLLLLPGALAWSQTWRDIAVPLGEAGFRVVALDLPPFGYSQRPADGDFSRQALGALVLGFADAIGLESFTLVGHSFGGGATMEAAMAAPARIRALVLLDVALGLGSPPGSGGALRGLLAPGIVRTALASATFANPLFTGMGLRGFIHDDTIVTDERIALYQAPLSVAGTSEAIGGWLLTGLFADESAAPSADPDAYERLDLPALVVWGREDTVTPLAQGEQIARLLPRSELVVLDGVDHIPHVEAPAAVVDAIVSFLEKVGGTITTPDRQDRLERPLRPAP